MSEDIYRGRTAKEWAEIAELWSNRLHETETQLVEAMKSLSYAKDELGHANRELEAYQRAFAEFVEFGSRHPSTYVDPVAEAENILRGEQ